MDGKVFDRFRESLLEQRQNMRSRLNHIYSSSPLRITGDAVQKHLEVLDSSVSRKPKIRPRHLHCLSGPTTTLK